jgi:peroxiredoxin
MMLKKSVLISAMLLLLFAGSAPAQSQRTDIHPDAGDVQPLLPGMQAPSFDVLSVEGEPVHFDPSKMDKPLVLSFFRGGWCPYCNLHLAEMRKTEGELRELGFAIWFTDSKLDATRSFGLAFRVSNETVEKYLKWDIDLEGASGETHHVLPAPSTFIISDEGIIRFQYTNPDYAVRLHPDVLLAAAWASKQEADGRLRREYKARKAAKESGG